MDEIEVVGGESQSTGYQYVPVKCFMVAILPLIQVVDLKVQIWGLFKRGHVWTEVNPDNLGFE